MMIETRVDSLTQAAQPYIFFAEGVAREPLYQRNHLHRHGGKNYVDRDDAYDACTLSDWPDIRASPQWRSECWESRMRSRFSIQRKDENLHLRKPC